MELSAGDFRVGNHSFGPCVLTIGNFDGVHRGHRQLIAETVKAAKEQRVPAVLLTFSPHPSHVVGREPVTMIDSRETMAAKVAPLGIDRVVIQKFDEKFAALQPEDFLRQYLVPLFSPKMIVIGDDFSFGKDKQGEPEFLAREFAALGCGFKQIPPYHIDGRRVSSRAIRLALAQGDVESANRWLGEPYTFCGQVVGGRQLGRQLGFPTANLRADKPCLLRTGVYAIEVQTSGVVHPGLLNLGRRPSLGDTGELSVECHLLDWAGDLYGETLQVAVLARRRDEMKFASLRDLQAQITRDVSWARDFFAGRGER